MWKTVLPRGLKLFGSVAGTAAGTVGVEADCHAVHSLEGSSSQLQVKQSSMKLSIGCENESDVDSWEMCGEEELTQAFYDVLGRKPRLIDIDIEESQPILSHDQMDDVDSVESIGTAADLLMDSIHYDTAPSPSPPPSSAIDQMQAIADLTMFVVTKPGVQQAITSNPPTTPQTPPEGPRLPPAAQNILVNNINFEVPFKKVLMVVFGTLKKIGDAIGALGSAIGGVFHDLANKIGNQLNMDKKEGENGGEGVAKRIGAVTILATAIILVVLVRRAGIPVPRRA